MNTGKIQKKIYFEKTYKLEALEKYLENMAREGWIFTKKKGIILYFTKCEPKEVHFTIDIFNEASNYSVKPDYYSEEYVDLCEQSGWKLLQTSGKLMFFCSEELNPMPIQTDSKIKLEAIVKCAKKESIIPFCTFLGLFLALIAMDIYTDTSLADRLIISGDILLLFIYLVISIIYGLDVIQFALFYRRNKKRIEQGEELTFEGSESSEKIRRVVKAVILVVMSVVLLISAKDAGVNVKPIIAITVGFIVLMTIVEWFRQGNSRISNDVSALLGYVPTIVFLILFMYVSFFDNTNIPNERISYVDGSGNTTEMTIYHADIPIKLEDLGVTFGEAKFVETDQLSKSTIFGKNINYTQYFYDKKTEMIGEGMECDILESRFNPILNSYIKDRLKLKWTKWHKVTNSEVDLWNAEEVYAGDGSDDVKYRIVKWKETVLFFYGQNVKLNKKNITMLRDKLELLDV